MQISKRDVNQRIERKIFNSLYQVLADFRKKDQVNKFLTDILSETEKTVIAKRLAIANYLTKNKSYDQIRRDLKVSSATIASIQNWLEDGGEGLALALKTIEADEWAGELAQKIARSFKKVFK